MISINGLIGNEKGQYSLVKLIEDIKKEPINGKIEIQINSPGGDGELAFQMYDYLKSLNRHIVTECIGNCSSAASILFLSGDYRIAGCPIMIHNPWVELSGDSAALKEASDWIGKFENRIEKFYEEHTHLDANTLSSLMKNETYMSPRQAVTFGFANQSRNIAKALINNNIKKTSEMGKEKKSFKEKLVEWLLADESEVKLMELISAAGETISFGKDSGEPAVGDAANPDGTYVMPDGSTIVILNGVVTDITPATPNNTELEQLKAENLNLKNQISQLNEKVAKAETNGKTQEEIAQLNAIKMAGGTDWLANQCSHYRPAQRKAQANMKEVNNEDGIGGNAAKALAKLREKRFN